MFKEVASLIFDLTCYLKHVIFDTTKCQALCQQIKEYADA